MNKDISFCEIAEELLQNKKFNKITQESHHGITRMEHSMRVARNVYRVSKKFKLDYVSATRAAILHDFFTNQEFGTNLGLVQGIIHPDIALENARGEFTLNKIEENAIEAHMFPLSSTLPKYKESWVLTAVDKVVAIYEYLSYKFHYTKLTQKLSYGLAFSFVILFNLITMGRK